MRSATIVSVALATLLTGPAARAACQLGASTEGRCASNGTVWCDANEDCSNQCGPAYCHRKYPNVILIIADDLGWQDLPFFAPALHWSNAAQTPQVTRKRRLMRPTLNRFEARLLAQAPLPGTSTTVPTIPLGRSALLDPMIHDGYAYPVEATALSQGTGHVYTLDAAAGATSAAAAAQLPASAFAQDVLQHVGGLRRLARGAVFSRFYSTAAYCAPARATIFTGRQTRRHGVRANGSKPLHDSEITIAEYLKSGCPSSGPIDPMGIVEGPCYKTALVGKWHVGNRPDEHGFDEYVSHDGSARDSFKPRLNCNVGHPRCRPHNKRHDVLDLSTLAEDDRAGAWPCSDNNDAVLPFTSTTIPGQDRCRYATRVYRDLALDFIKRHQYTAKPFFLTLAFNAVHVPHGAPERTKRHYTTAGAPVGANGRGETYWAMIEEMDAAVGRILRHLDVTTDGLGEPLSQNTVVFFTSDHGAPERPYGVPMLRGGKASSYEGGMQVGLLARACMVEHDAAAVTEADYEFHAEVGSHVDLFATIAEIANKPVSTGTAGGQSYNYILVGGNERIIWKCSDLI